MTYHFSPDQINALGKCVESCETLIDACQKLVDMCSVSNATECAEQVGITVGLSKQCMQWCQETIEKCQQHGTKCKDQRCKEVCNDCVDACEGAILQASAIIRECKAGNEECLDKCSNVTAFDTCAQVCQRYKELGQLT